MFIVVTGVNLHHHLRPYDYSLSQKKKRIKTLKRRDLLLHTIGTTPSESQSKRSIQMKPFMHFPNVKTLNARFSNNIAKTLLLLAIVVSGFSQVSPYKFSTPVQSKPDAEMDAIEIAAGINIPGYDPYIDTPMWMLNMADGSHRYYYQSITHYSIHQGTIASNDWFDNVIHAVRYDTLIDPDNPVQNRYRGIQWPTSTGLDSADMPYEQKEFLMSVHKVNDNELLGFFHIERTHSTFINPGPPAHSQRVAEAGDRLFAIGIGWSIDTGKTWDYCGDIILPHFDGYDDGLSSNIGGVPYIINGNSLHIYYNEAVNAVTPRYNSVASAPIDSVIADARDRFVNLSYWRKWHNGSFSESSITGVGDPIITYPTPFFLDLHSSAAYCTASGEYILTAPANPDFNNNRAIYLFSSLDGLNWTQRGVIDRRLNYNTNQLDLTYAGIVSEFSGASDDNSIVGNEFYIVYAERDWKGSDTTGTIVTNAYYVRVNSSEACAIASHVMGFEDASKWQLIAGNGILSNNGTMSTLGTSMEISGNGWQQIRSSSFSTTCLNNIDNTLSMDLFVGLNQPNPYWIGEIQLYVHCPSANIYNQYIGQTMLDNMNIGAFNEVTFTLPPDVINLITSDHTDFSWSIALSTNPGSGPYYVDNMRF